MLCVYCGEREAVSNRRCVVCREKNSASQAKVKKRRQDPEVCWESGCMKPVKDLGKRFGRKGLPAEFTCEEHYVQPVCYWCKKNPVESTNGKGQRTCDECQRAKNTAKHQKYRNKKTTAGVCKMGTCGKPCWEGKTTCKEHTEANRIEANERNDGIRREFFAIFGNKCCCCEISTLEFLTDDHINGGGSAYRAAAGKTGVNYIKTLLKLPREALLREHRAACFNCNRSFMYHAGQCIHKLPLEQMKASPRRVEVLRAYGGVCVCCGESILELLTFDHINRDGAEWRRQNAGRSVVSFLIEQHTKTGAWDPTFQILCFNCNSGRERHDGVCPHKL